MTDNEIFLTTAEPRLPNQESNFDIRDYLRIILSRWRLILIVTLACGILGAVHFIVTPPQYRAETLLQIEQNSPLALSDASNPYLEAWLTQKYYPTQYRLLKSRGFAERVVRQLNLAGQLGLNSAGLDQNPEQVNDEAVLANLARRLLSGISVGPISGTELVVLSYTSPRPEHAADIINAFAQEYINWSIENRSVRIDKTSRFLQKELEELRKELREKEVQLEEYSRNSEIVSLDPSSNPTLQRLSSLNAELLKAQGVWREKEARYRELAQLPRESVAAEESKGLITELQMELLSKQRDYDAKLQIYKPDWPAMTELRAAIEDGKVTYQQAVDKHFKDAENRYRGEAQAASNQAQRLKGEIATVKNEALNLGSASVEYNNLQMEIEARRERQDYLLDQISKASMSARMFGERESNVRVVEKALVPSRSVRPSLSMDLTAGLSGGLILGIGIVLLLHLLDRTIKTPEELEANLQLPVLGVIPDLSARSRGYGSSGTYGYGSRPKPDQPGEIVRQIELLPARHPRQAVSEAYRSLRTALLLSSARALQLIAITSADSGEGKTATAANLGTVLAQLGKRVLLVDGDMRRPRMYKVFDVSNRAGLVNYLTGTVEPESLILPTEVEGLFLCPAGPHPPNPSELVASDRMKDFLSFARQTYDFVIVDSPPVLAVTDAVLIGAMCDGVVLCFHSNKVLREDVQTCRNRLLRSEVRVLGGVLNRYSPARSGGYGRKYYYYESYGEEVESSSAA